jgi:hypothetical protein
MHYSDLVSLHDYTFRNGQKNQDEIVAIASINDRMNIYDGFWIMVSGVIQAVQHPWFSECLTHRHTNIHILDALKCRVDP